MTRVLGLAATTTALAAFTALSGVAPADAAQAGETRLYAPSALVLTLVDGDDVNEGTILRGVTLSCMPTATGTHPDPAGACTELRASNASFATLAATGSRALCTREWRPLSVTVDGVWEGTRVSFQHTFANRCALEHSSDAVFSF